MKWVIVVASLFMHTQVSATGLCLPTADGEELSRKCIVGWNGVTNYIAYSGALSAMIDKFTTVIAYDSYVNHAYWFGFECRVYFSCWVAGIDKAFKTKPIRMILM